MRIKLETFSEILYKNLKKNNIVFSFKKELDLFMKTLREYDFFHFSFIKDDDSRLFLFNVLKKNFSKFFLDILEVIISKNWVLEFKKFVSIFNHLMFKDSSIIQFKFISSHFLSNEMQDYIYQKLALQYPENQIYIHFKADKMLIGGFVLINLNSYVLLDHSIFNKISLIKKRLFKDIKL